MPKTSKTKTAGAETAAPASNEATTASTESAATATAKPARRARKSTAKKAASGTVAKKRATKTRAKSVPTEPSDADIRLRAYFIAERRVQLALHGDPAKDWLEAKQQLLDEARQQT